MDKDNSRFLIDLHKKGKKAWEKLYDLYYPSLCNYTSRLVGDEDVAADLIQKLMIRMWELDLSFINIKALTAYLYRAARNSSITYINQLKFEKEKLADVSFANDTDSDLDDSMIMIIEEEMIRELYNGIAELPKQQAEIMLLSSKGMTVKQVAKKLDVSVNTVKTQKKRAYVALKEKLKHSLFLLLFMSV
jgi:RNA polymerase sigma-70 factor (ECF subfamily)